MRLENKVENSSTNRLETTESGPPTGFGHNVNQYLNQHIVVADAKAVALLGTNLTLAALFIVNRPLVHTAVIANWISICCFTISALIATYSLFPRLLIGGRGLIFWEDIVSRRTPSEYISDLTAVSLQQVEFEYADLNFYLSKILVRKYRAIQVCTVLLMVGILAMLCRFILS